MNTSINNNVNTLSIRQSNIELLRIVSMIFIIAHHVAVHGGLEFSTKVITVNRLWIQFLHLGGKIGVDIFVLISGYFLITSSTMKINKLLKLWFQIFTYSILFFTIFCFFIEPESFSIKDLIRNLFPVIFNRWWFASTYFVLYILSPFINKFLTALTKKEYQKFLLLLSIIWILIPTFTTMPFQSNKFLIFVYLYSLAGYVKLHTKENNISDIIYLIVAFVLIILTFLSAVVFDFIALKIERIGSYTTYFYEMEKLPIVLISLFMFLGFRKINMNNNRLINIVSATTFGIYLIHTNKFLRPFIWKNLIQLPSLIDNFFLIPYTIFVIIAVFIGCSLIELFRIQFFEKHYLKTLNQISINIDSRLQKILNHKFFDKI